MSVARSLDRYPGTGGDGTTSARFLKAVDVKTKTHNSDGLEGKTRGNGTCRAGKPSHDYGTADTNEKDETITEISSGTKKSKVHILGGKANCSRADTGKVTSELKETFAASDGDKAADRFAETVGKNHNTIRALTGNLYRAAPTDDTDNSDTEIAGLEPENDKSPFERANIEPAIASDDYITKTRARECGLGEIRVRGIGVRVAVAVVRENGPRKKGEDTKTKSKGGDSTTNHIDEMAHTIGNVEKAPEGEAEAQLRRQLNTRRTKSTHPQ